MPGCFGLCEDHGNPYRFPGDRIVERVPRVDIRMLTRYGALVQGTTTELEIEPTGGPRSIRTVNFCRVGSGVTIEGVLVRLSWDEAFERERPWFECPVCSRRCRHVYLRGQIGCRRCHRLDYSVRHVCRQIPGAARVARLRRRLGCEDLRPFAPLPPRRRGQRRAHYERLVAQIHDEEEKLVAHLGSIVYDLTRRLRVRRGQRHDRTKASPRSGSISD